MYEIQHYTLCDGWINTWSITDDDGNESLETFETFADASMALDEFLEDEAWELEQGNIESPYTRDEFRIVKLEGVSA
jgi:hypothetical protein